MALLEVKGLHKSFGKLEVLKGIDISLEKGQVLAIIGSSGSGKTTLLRCLNFLESADRGTITVGGKKVYDPEDKALLSPSDIRKNRLSFGLVFQSYHLFPQYTVLNNLTMPAMLKLKTNPDFKKKKSEYCKNCEKQALDLLSRIGLESKKDAYPCELSGGQQQRVAIARALMLTPEILCFDEPTSALDPELTREVLRVIRDLKENNTMIVVTHEMNFARNVADHVIFMSGGIIEEQGLPEELFGNPKSPILRSFLNDTEEL